MLFINTISNSLKISTRFYTNQGFKRQVLKLPKYVRKSHQKHEEEEHNQEEIELCNLIGNREIVGYGINGLPSYFDSPVFPFPSIRWQETTPEIMALREKEKGDWKGLSEEDKKLLYRASFRQTFAEMKAPTGEWKSVLGWALFISTLGLWGYIFIHFYVHNPWPHTYGEEPKKHQLKRILGLKINPIHGMASQWDYEKEEWK